jgi:hypothetical protein
VRAFFDVPPRVDAVALPTRSGSPRRCWTGEVERLVVRLGVAVPPAAALVPAHGDFHSGQLLHAHGRLFVVDVDAMCLAPPALDVAEYVAAALEPGRARRQPSADGAWQRRSARAARPGSCCTTPASTAPSATRSRLVELLPGSSARVSGVPHR